MVFSVKAAFAGESGRSSVALRCWRDRGSARSGPAREPRPGGRETNKRGPAGRARPHHFLSSTKFRAPSPPPDAFPPPPEPGPEPSALGCIGEEAKRPRKFLVPPRAIALGPGVACRARGGRPRVLPASCRPGFLLRR